jgi:uncharacterized protein YutE (UPF0331/DUF86 family)
MDRELIDQKLESLRRSLTRIRTRCPNTLEALIDDIDAQDIITLNLSRAIQLSVDVAMHMASQLNVPTPGTMGAAFEALSEQRVIDPDVAERMRKAVGFRNIAVHNYEAINWEVVLAIVQQHLGDFDDFAKSIDRWLTSH